MRQVHNNRGGTGATGITLHPVPAENPTVLPLTSSLSASSMPLDEWLAVISMRVKSRHRRQLRTNRVVPGSTSDNPMPGPIALGGEGSFLQAGRVASGVWYVYQRDIKWCILWGDAILMSIPLASGGDNWYRLRSTSNVQIPESLQLSNGTSSGSSSQPSHALSQYEFVPTNYIVSPRPVVDRMQSGH